MFRCLQILRLCIWLSINSTDLKMYFCHLDHCLDQFKGRDEGRHLVFISYQKLLLDGIPWSES